MRKLARVEGLQLFQLFTHANKVNRHRPLPRNGRQHTAFGRAVQFGDDEARQPQGFVEGLDLGEGILPRVAVNHQQHFVRGCGISLLDDAFDLFQLVHQVDLCGQPPGGIHQYHILVTGLACTHRIKTDGGRVTACLADDFHRVAVRPYRELFTRGGTKGVSGGQQNTGPMVCKVRRQLADGCGLARAIHAHHHDDGGFVFANHQRFLQRLQHLAQAGDQNVFQRHRVSDAAAQHLAAQVGQQKFGGGNTGVGHQQSAFQVLVQRFVDLRAREHARDAGCGFAQASFELVQPFLPFGRRGAGHGDVNRCDQRASDHGASSRWRRADRQWCGCFVQIPNGQGCGYCASGWHCSHW